LVLLVAGALGVAVGGGTSNAADASRQSGERQAAYVPLPTAQWLGINKARHLVAANTVPLVYCDSVGGDGACLTDWTAVLYRVTAGTIRGYGASRVKNGQRQWRVFTVNATCGSDRNSGLQFRSRFLWEWNRVRYFAESTNPSDFDQTGVARLGC
jgi:hypothetical protein